MQPLSPQETRGGAVHFLMRAKKQDDHHSQSGVQTYLYVDYPQTTGGINWAL